MTSEIRLSVCPKLCPIESLDWLFGSKFGPILFGPEPRPDKICPTGHIHDIHVWFVSKYFGNN